MSISSTYVKCAAVLTERDIDSAIFLRITDIGFTSTVPGAQTCAGDLATGAGLVNEIFFGPYFPDATAMVFNATVTEPETAGFLTAFPCSPNLPTVSNVNFVAGQTVPNLVISAVDSVGSVCLFNSTALHWIVDVGGFEGPLDLLLYLVRKEEVDIHDVNLTKIATEFIEYVDTMRVLDLEIAGEFLVMAATLVYIKSRELLPVDQQATPEGEEEGGDYFVDLKDKAVSSTEEGIEKMEGWLGVENMYDADPRLARHFEQALRAHALYKRDRDYIVKDGEIVIVDEFTGRQMPGRHRFQRAARPLP